MKNYRDLNVWKQAHEYVLHIYKLTKSFPREEIYGITSQIRRSALSIPANIAEGCGRNSDAELRRFLEIAYGSASENDYLLLLSHQLCYVKNEDYSTLLEQLNGIRRMLNTFIRKLKAQR